MIVTWSVGDGVTRFRFLRKDSYQQDTLQEEGHHLSRDDKMKHVYVHIPRLQIEPVDFTTVSLLFEIFDQNKSSQRKALRKAF